MERINFIYQNGKRIVSMDFAKTSSETIILAMNDACKTLNLQADRSILALIDFTETPFNDDVVIAMAKFVNNVIAYSQKIALIGLVGLRKVVVESAIKDPIKKVFFFDDLAAAQAWLTE